jgi:hypothetical protein
MKRWQNRRFCELVSKVTETRDVLARQTDLSPRNTTVNQKLTELVRYVTLPHNQAAARRALQVLSESGVTADLRALCQRAEFQLELFYSDPDRVLDFPYIDHYLKLALKESELANLNSNSRVVFVGGGPLPWTPLVLTIVQAAQAQGMIGELTRCLSDNDPHADAQLKRVIHREFWRDWPSAFQILSVEKEPEAAAQAVKALTKLGMQDHVQVTQVDGAHLVVPPGFDTFFIASMVTEKERVMLNIMSQVAPGQEVTFLVRSVDPVNMRALLYEPADDLLEDMEACIPGLTWMDTFLPGDGSQLINSVHVYKYRRPQESETEAAA